MDPPIEPPITYRELSAFVFGMPDRRELLDCEPVAILQAVMGRLAAYARSLDLDELFHMPEATERRLKNDISRWLENDISYHPQWHSAFLDFVKVDAACWVVAVLEVIRFAGHNARCTRLMVHRAQAWTCERGQRQRLLAFLDLLRHGFAGEAFPPGIGEARVTYARRDAMTEFLCALACVMRPEYSMRRCFTLSWPEVQARARQGPEDYASRLASLAFTRETVLDLRDGNEDPAALLRVIASDGAPRWDVPYAVDVVLSTLVDCQRVFSPLMKEMLAQELAFLTSLLRHPVCPYTSRVSEIGKTWADASDCARLKRGLVVQNSMLVRHIKLVEAAKAALPIVPVTFAQFFDSICALWLLNGAVFQWRARPAVDCIDPRTHLVALADETSRYVKAVATMPEDVMALYPRFPNTYRAIGACDGQHVTTAKLPAVLQEVVEFYVRHRPGIIDTSAADRLRAVIANELGLGFECSNVRMAKREHCVHRLLQTVARERSLPGSPFRSRTGA
jgi:hypothetical protein